MKAVFNLLLQDVPATAKGDLPQCLSLAWPIDAQTLFARCSDNKFRAWQVLGNNTTLHNTKLICLCYVTRQENKNDTVDIKINRSAKGLQKGCLHGFPEVYTTGLLMKCYLKLSTF